MQENFPDQKKTQPALTEFPFNKMLEYPATEDMYIKGKEDKTVDPEDLPEIVGKANASLVEMDNSEGADLDVPGSELDDDMEAIGSEDEENNYYSLGGDDHNDLDEDRPE